MRSPKSAGRIVGILLLAHLVSGLMTPYIIIQPLTRSLPFTAGDLPNSFRVRLAVMLLLASAALVIAITVTAWPILRAHSRALALWVLALAAANFALQCVENAGYMTLFTFRQEYASAIQPDMAIYNVVDRAVRTAWKWGHYTHLLMMVSWMSVLFAAFWKSALVPRVLAALAVLATLLQITGITLPQFLAYPPPPPMLVALPLAFAYAAMSVWLMAKGFPADERS